MKLHSIVPAAIGLCLSLLASGEAKAATFTFTKIADTSSTFSSFFSIIASGDPLLGSTIANIITSSYEPGLNINFSPRGLNNRGQFAFFARLADGRIGIFRAAPVTVPESSLSIFSILSFSIGGGTLLKRKQKKQNLTT